MRKTSQKRFGRRCGLDIEDRKKELWSQKQSASVKTGPVTACPSEHQSQLAVDLQ